MVNQGWLPDSRNRSQLRAHVKCNQLVDFTAHCQMHSVTQITRFWQSHADLITASPVEGLHSLNCITLMSVGSTEHSSLSATKQIDEKLSASNCNQITLWINHIRTSGTRSSHFQLLNVPLKGNTLYTLNVVMGSADKGLRTKLNV